MSSEILVIIAVLAIGAGWWLYRSKRAVARKSQEEEDPFERHDHARAYEIAKAQAEAQRWSGPH